MSLYTHVVLDPEFFVIPRKLKKKLNNVTCRVGGNTVTSSFFFFFLSGDGCRCCSIWNPRGRDMKCIHCFCIIVYRFEYIIFEAKANEWVVGNNQFYLRCELAVPPPLMQPFRPSTEVVIRNPFTLQH